MRAQQARSTLVYIAGPYAAGTTQGIHDNVQRAMKVARLVMLLAPSGRGIHYDLDVPHRGVGYVPVVPHALGVCGLFGSGLDDGTPSQTRTVALLFGLRLLRACEALVALDSDSAGTRAEIERAQSLKMQVVVYPFAWYQERLTRLEYLLSADEVERPAT